MGKNLPLPRWMQNLPEGTISGLFGTLIALLVIIACAVPPVCADNTTPTTGITNTTATTTATATSTVTATVTATATQTQPPLPVASFTYSPSTISPGTLVTFTDTSTGSPTGYYWYFGNGGVSTLKYPPVQTYPSAGTYSVSLTVSNSVGTSAVYTRSIVVEPANTLDANFYFSPSSPDAGDSVSFTDISTGDGINEWSWDFDDAMDFTGNRVSTLQNPSHTYENTGSYYVTLTVWNDSGSDIIGKTVTVNPPPTPTPSPYRLSLSEGWNLASIPLINATYTVPSSVYSHVFSYDNVRQEYNETNISDMQAGNGYWIASAADVVITLYGEPVSSYSCNGTKGWNLIGSLGFETTGNGITLNSMALSNPVLYGYDGRTRLYQLSGYLLPSHGYWIYLNENGIVNVTMSPPSFPE